MATYRIPKEISTELKINKALYLFDLIFILGVLAITLVFKNFIHPLLFFPYYIFMGFFALVMIWRPFTNPQKRMYQVLYITIMKSRDTYCAIDTEQE